MTMPSPRRLETKIYQGRKASDMTRNYMALYVVRLNRESGYCWREWSLIVYKFYRHAG